MKNLFLITILFLLILDAKAQSIKGDPSDLDKIEIKELHFDAKYTDNKEPIFTSVEIEPKFQGGMDEFYAYLQQNIVYPINALKQKIEGQVFIGFVVEMGGSLTNIKILKGVSPEIDTEAGRVIGNAPNWLPGLQNGKPVRVQYSLAVNFKLPPQEPTNVLQNDTSRDNMVFIVVDQKPEFKGGITGFFKYFQHTIHYPANASKNNIQGRVFVSFIVEKDGTITNIKISRGVSEDLDAEAARVIRESPQWNPGLEDGKPVRVAYIMPIDFTLKHD